MEHFGEKLRRLRASRSQKDVAQDLDIPQTTLSSLEKQENVPRGEVLKKLAEFFAVPVEYFYATPEINVSDQASAWLNQLRTQSKGRDTVATHSSSQFEPNVLEEIAAKLRKKFDETKGK